jgi:hypothetical protein
MAGASASTLSGKIISNKNNSRFVMGPHSPSNRVADSNPAGRVGTFVRIYPKQ